MQQQQQLLQADMLHHAISLPSNTFKGVKQCVWVVFVYECTKKTLTNWNPFEMPHQT